MGLFNNNNQKSSDELPKQDLMELFQRMEQLERKCAGLERLEEKYRKLEARVAELESRRSEPVVQDSFQPVGLTAMEVAQPVQQPQAETFQETRPEPVASASQCLYLAAPTADGSFPQVSEREQIGKSIYQLTTTDGVNGTFILLDTPDAIATAMISVSQFIKTVCKVVGNTSQFPRHLITEEEGVATREGTVWKVTRKAVVRFE